MQPVAALLLRALLLQGWKARNGCYQVRIVDMIKEHVAHGGSDASMNR